MLGQTLVTSEPANQNLKFDFSKSHAALALKAKVIQACPIWRFSYLLYLYYVRHRTNLPGAIRRHAIPSSVIHSLATPSVIPSLVIPSHVIPSHVIPSLAIPSHVIPSLAIPSRVIPSLKTPSCATVNWQLFGFHILNRFCLGWLNVGIMPTSPPLPCPC